MKKIRFIAILVFLLVETMAFAMTLENTSAIAEGTYYMYNTKAQGYLVGANNWGTQASLDPVSGITVDLALLEDGKYTISTATSYGRFLGTDGYVDQDAYGWTIAKVGGQEGVYTIAHASKGYLQSQDGTTVLNFNETLTDAAYWQLLTKTDLEARFAGASEANPADATFYIQNPNFSRNASHSRWTGGATSSGDFQWGNGSNGNFNAQMWNGTFAIETTAADVPNGRYRMYIQGFYREGNIAPAAQNYPNETLRAHYSLNDVVGTFKSVFEEAGVPGNDGVDSNNLGVTPNNQTQVSTAFTNGLYENAPIVAEVTNHELTIRIYKDEAYQNDWTVWDNIRLQYIGGANLDSYQEALANAVSAAEAIEGTIPQAAYEALAAVVNEQNKEYGTCEEYASAVAAITEATNAAKALQTVYADYFVVKAKVQTLKNQNVYTDETGAVATFDAAVAAQDAIVESAVNAASIRAAIDTVKAAGLSFISSVRLTGAFDLTEIYVVNATPNTNVSGWTVQGGSASFQANCGEFWNASGASIRQTISGLPAGYYTLTAIAFTRTNMVARLFANENTMNLVTVESSVVNNRTQADVWFNNGNGVNELSFDLTEAGDVEIGLIADNTTNDHWMVWRSFQLKYVANTLDDYLTMVESMLADEFASAVYTKSYYSEVEEALAQVTVKEEADAFLNGTPLQSLRENVAAWTSFYSWYTTFRDNYYNKEITMGNTVADHAEDTKIGAAQELAALTEQTESWYEWYQAKDIEQNVTTEMILQMMEQCDSLYDLACLQIITRYITAGSDLSIYIKNPDFYSDGGTLNGWIVASGQNEYGHDNQTPRWYDNFHRVLECWNGDFNISQDFVLPRTGVYSISTHGFYRTADNQTLGAANAAWTIWCEANGENTGANESRAFFYADNLEKPLPNICNRTYTRAEIDAIGAAYDAEVAAKKPSRFSNRCDEFPYDFLLVEGSNEDGLFIPNGVYSADYVFNHPVYSQSYEAKFTFIATQGKTLRFGIKCENAGVPANDIGWTLFDQLTLTFDGADHAVLDPFMAEVVEQAKLVAEKPMNCDSLSALNTAIQIYETSTDADEIIAAYDAINDAIAPARHSALAYEPLVEAVQRLATETALYDDMEFNPVRDNAYTSIAEYNQALEDGIYKDDEVGAVIDQIDGIVEQLRNFDPLTYPWPINENELNILREVYDVAGQSQELKTSWSNIHSTEDIYNLNGVTSVGGRVLSVNLPGKNIEGDVLSLFLSLPYVQEINLRDNQISSEIETLITPNENLISLDISDNAITGNIGLMAQNAPHLNSLYASGNHLSQVSPPLPTSISTVYLDHQTIDEPIDYQSSYLLRDQLLDQIPTILLYNTYNHDYSDGLNAIVRDDDETPTWAAALNIDGNGMSLTSSSVASPIFRGQSGSVLSVVTSNGSHRFRMGYTFEQGDANFDCETDISDLQHLINYSLSESYQGLLNLTAIDLLADQDINIMDIVRMVNLLLDQDSQPAASRNSVGHENLITDDGGEASLFFRDGKLVLSTSVPIAALDLLILSDHEQQMKWEFEDSGFQIRQRKGNGLTHVILYSTEGRNIPVGETILAALSTTSSVIQKAILVQQDGTKIKANIETTVPTRIDMAETNVPVVKMGQHGEIFVTTPVQLDQVTWTIHSFDGTCVTSGVCESLSPGCHSISVLPEGYRQVILRFSSNQVSITKKISK